MFIKAYSSVGATRPSIPVCNYFLTNLEDPEPTDSSTDKPTPTDKDADEPNPTEEPTQTDDETPEPTQVRSSF
jgi:hypothetical protein